MVHGGHPLQPENVIGPPRHLLVLHHELGPVIPIRVILVHNAVLSEI
jgi:hypothetical protein